MIEYDNKYHLGGKYFDKDIGWTVHMTIYDEQGDCIKKHILRQDTAFANQEIPHMIEDSNGLYFGAGAGPVFKMMMYDKNYDTLRVSTKFRYDTLDFYEWGYAFSKEKDKLYFCGRTDHSDDIYDYSTASVMQMDSSGARGIYRHDIGGENQQTALSMDVNSKGHLVASCIDYALGENENDTIFIMIFDEDLNVLHNSWGTDDAVGLRLAHGICLDQYDNIIVTGRKMLVDENGRTYSLPTLIKFDSEGKFLWKKQLGASNKSWFSGWESVIESKEKDGYIVVGGLDKQEGQVGLDTTIVAAAIAKLSYDGDSLWTRTYSFRDNSLTSVEVFSDVILSSDGHYVASGRSTNFDKSDPPWIQSMIVKMNDQGIYDPEGISSVTLSDNDMTDDMIVYPNPVSDQLIISQNMDNLLKARVISQSGQTISTFVTYGLNHSHILDTSGFSPGIYYIIATDNSGKEYNSTFIVQLK